MPLTCAVLLVLMLTANAVAGVQFSVKLDPSASSKPVSGRLVVSLISDQSKLRPGTSPLDAPFWDDPQPMFGVDVLALKPGASATIERHSDYSIVPLADLPPGNYSAAAFFITSRTASSWRDDADNFFGDTVTFSVPKDASTQTVTLSLTGRTSSHPLPKANGVAWFSVPSKLLSEFHGRDVLLKAGVVLPVDYDPSRKYAAVYWVPGFGDDQTDAMQFLQQWRSAPADSAEGRLARQAFLIALDPESPNGHTLFADSDNNGPCGQSLVLELIPALEAQFPLIGKPAARLLRGHSSGGWSCVWLVLNYPETFGAAWSSSPDPVDFSRFQCVDLYQATNLYSGKTEPPTDYPSYRRGNRVLMTIRQERGGERVLGSDQTSGQQWDSWQAVFGPRVGRKGWGKGHPAALADTYSGVIDPKTLEHFKAYDIALLIRNKPAQFGPILRDRVRIVVGDQDSFYLNEAVARLKQTATEQGFADARITIVPDQNHFSIMMSPQVRAFTDEMVHYLKTGALSPTNSAKP